MKFLLLFVIFHLQCTETGGFLSGPISSILNVLPGNITCLEQTTTTNNGTTAFNYGIANSSFSNISFASNYLFGAAYCIVYQINQTTNGLLQVQTTWTMTSTVNEFRNTAINRCGFSSSMDIGYGYCTNRPFDTPGTTTFLCICPTNNCSITLASCRSSVDQAVSSPPPLLPIVIPTLNNSINCSGTTSCDVGVILNLINTYNYSACLDYAATHTFMCVIDYTNVTGGVLAIGLIDGSYETYVKDLAIYSAFNGIITSIYLYEGSTNMMTITPATAVNDTFTYTSNGNVSTIVITEFVYPTAQCFCTTDSCNEDLDVCASGLNYPSSLLVVNVTNGTTISNINATTILSTSSSTVTSSSYTTTTTHTSTTSSSHTTTITHTSTTSSSHTTMITQANTTSSSPTTTITHANTTSSSHTTTVTCFSSDSQVKMFDGTYKNIAQLQPGDRVAVPTESYIVLMLDGHPSQKTSFYTIETESGKRISLSAYHLIAIQSAAHHTSKMMYKLARDVRVGEFLFNDELLPEQVLSIIQEVKVGYFAPMSEAGTLIVNGLLASCYANVLSHQLAHWMMAPLRLKYQLNEAFGVKQHLHQEIGVHPFASWMMDWTERFIPKQISFLVIQSTVKEPNILSRIYSAVTSVLHLGNNRKRCRYPAPIAFPRTIPKNDKNTSTTVANNLPPKGNTGTSGENAPGGARGGAEAGIVTGAVVRVGDGFKGRTAVCGGGEGG